MRVLFLTSTLPRFSGDMQADFVGQQAEAWAQARPGDRLIVLAPGDIGAASREMRGGVEVRRFQYMAPAGWQKLAYPAILPNVKRNPLLLAQLPFFLFAQYRAARHIVREEAIDLVYAHWVMPQGVVAWRLKAATGVPYVLQNHSSDLSVFTKLGAPGIALARKVLAGARAFFCVNSSQRDFALSLMEGAGRDDLAGKMNVLPMGVVPPAPPAQDAGEGYDLATIGRLSSKKGIDLLIAAAEVLAGEGLRPSVGIAGDGEDREALHGLPDKADVRWPGFLMGAEKDAFLHAGRAFVFPALAQGGDVEGMPVALLEAMAMGKPVVASRDTNVAMLPEWPEIRDCIEYVEDPRDAQALATAMRKVLEMGDADRERRARVLRDKVGRYLWPRLIGEYHAGIGLDQGRAGFLPPPS